MLIQGWAPIPINTVAFRLSYFTGISSLNVVSGEYNYILTETDKLGLVQLTMESSDIELS